MVLDSRIGIKNDAFKRLMNNNEVFLINLTHIAAFWSKNQKNQLITNELLTISELFKSLEPHYQRLVILRKCRHQM